MIPLPYKLAGFAVAAVVIFFLGRENGLSKYYDFKSWVEAEQARAKAESDRVTSETAQGWAAAVDWHRRNPRIVRVRDNCEVQVPGAPTGTDEAAASGTINSEQAETYLNQGILDAAQLLHLQDWIRKQQEVTK